MERVGSPALRPGDDREPLVSRGDPAESREFPKDEEAIVTGSWENHRGEGSGEESISNDDRHQGEHFLFETAAEVAHAPEVAPSSHHGSHTRGTGLRRRGDGTRRENTSLGFERGVSAPLDDTFVWTPLTSPLEMQYYRFSVAVDPGEILFRSLPAVRLVFGLDRGSPRQ